MKTVAVDADIPVKGIKYTTLDEALRCKNFYKKQGDEDLAAKYLEHALTLAKDHNQRAELMLDLADLYMNLEKRDKASKYYTQYKTFYPGSPQIKYVLYQELVSTELEAFASDKDQTKTKAALKLAQTFASEFPDDTEHIPSVKEVIDRCYIKLTKSELKAATFYVNKYYYQMQESSLKAAHKRIDFLLKEYAYPIKDGHKLLGLGSKITTKPIEAYLGSLEAVLEELYNFVDEHDVDEENFITRLLKSQRNGRSSQRTRK